MGTQGATIIIEPRLLVREGLKSLMGSHFSRVVCGVGSTTNIVHPSIAADGAKLVILGAQSADISVSEASGIRRLWPNSKIVLLFEYASPADFQKLLTSEIDGCVPLFVSPETLINTLELIITRDVRVMVKSDTELPSVPAADKDVSRQSEIKIDNAQSDGTKDGAIPATEGAVNGRAAEARNGDTPHVSPQRNRPRLSEREVQVLICLVKGHANKVIARTCNITEATAKVHVKSILQKIGVANRTLAAIWALENGYAYRAPQDPASVN
jgi:two-component system, NarL family, nitrate/nitrite response regulator NarL